MAFHDQLMIYVFLHSNAFLHFGLDQQKTVSLHIVHISTRKCKDYIKMAIYGQFFNLFYTFINECKVLVYPIYHMTSRLGVK